MIRLQPERFTPGSFTKLHARWAGPFSVLQKLGANAYLIDLPKEYNFSPIFNIKDLTLYRGEDQSSFDDSSTPIHLPSTKTYETVDTILDHQFVSTWRSGYHKFLVRWANKPLS